MKKQPMRQEETIKKLKCVLKKDEKLFALTPRFNWQSGVKFH